jgi:hypothetical protein
MVNLKSLFTVCILLGAMSSCAAVPSEAGYTGKAEAVSQDQLKENLPQTEAAPIEVIPPSSEGTPIKVIPPDSGPNYNYTSPGQENAAIPSYAFIKMVATGKVNSFGNPIYEVLLYNNSNLVSRLQAVTGRAHTQSKDRNVGNNEAPLPNGRYRVATSWVNGTTAEVGGRFLPITPLFRTGRTDLGFHVDPSYNRDRKEDGTAGCIGLVSVSDRDILFNFARQYRPQYLDVQI